MRISGQSIQFEAGSSKGRTISIGSTANLLISKKKINGDWIWMFDVPAQNKKVSQSTTKVLLAGNSLRINGRALTSSGRQLPPNLVLQGDEQFDVIAHLNLEDYLLGVIAHEMPRTWPLESLKAQAIASRSYALAVAQQRQSFPFDVENTVMDQVFHFIEPSRSSLDHLPAFERAVRETRGIVLSSPAGEILKSFYHADCGGLTEMASAVWGSPDLEVRVPDQSCALRSTSQWVYYLKSSEIQKKLKSNWTEIKMIRAPGDSRVQMVLAKDSQGKLHRFTGNQFRQALGFGKIKSTRFSVQRRKEGWLFSGLGSGHGVGLCQWGSRDLAKGGNSFSQILRHYYPQSRLESRDNLDREKRNRHKNKNLVYTYLSHTHNLSSDEFP